MLRLMFLVLSSMEAKGFVVGFFCFVSFEWCCVCAGGGYVLWSSLLAHCLS